MSMGPLFDRHNEHPVAFAGAAIVRYRHLLRQEADRIASGQQAHFAHSGFDCATVLSGSGILPDGQGWHELVAGNAGRSLTNA
jgi:hypothetical protein